MYLLCQKLGYLSEEGRFDEDGPGAMVAFNGFEAPVYFVKTITGYPRLRKYVKGSDAIYRIARQMYEYSLAHCRDQKSAGIAGRHGYEQIALYHLWELGLQTGRADEVVPRMKEALRSAPTEGMRANAATLLAEYYEAAEDNYRKAADMCAAMALGTCTGHPDQDGISMLRGLADRSGDPAIARRCREVATKMLNQYSDQMDPVVVRRVRRLTKYTTKKSDKESSCCGKGK
jgi:hypothetical protein